MLRLLMLVSLLCGAPASGFAAGRECGGRERPDRPDGLAVSAESPLFTFGVVTDVHYSNVKETWAARRYAESGEKLREAVAAFNRAHVDFVVSLGDMIDGDIGSYAVIRPILEGSAAPVYKILGNHDYLGPYGSEEQRRVLEELGISEPYFSVVRNGYRLAVPRQQRYFGLRPCKGVAGVRRGGRSSRLAEKVRRGERPAIQRCGRKSAAGVDGPGAGPRREPGRARDLLRPYAPHAAGRAVYVVE
ncbi:MAG: metallophosphoesterase [Alistipes finegoldii]